MLRWVVSRARRGWCKAGVALRVRCRQQLVALTGTVDAVAAGTDEAATGGAGAACFITGAGDVDVQLNRYAAGWSGQLHQLAPVTGQTADALIAAAADYVTTDSGVIGGSGPSDTAAGDGQ